MDQSQPQRGPTRPEAAGQPAIPLDERVIVGFKVPPGTGREDPLVRAVIDDYRESVAQLTEAALRRLDALRDLPAAA